LNIEILTERLNPLIGRKETKFLVHHEEGGTPDRLSIRKIASEQFKIPADKIYVRTVRTRTGGSSAICEVEMYEDSKIAEKIVPAYVRNRNLPPNQRTSRKKGEEEKSAPPAPKPPTPEKKIDTAKPPAPKETRSAVPAPAEPKSGSKPEPKQPAKAPAKAEGKPKQ